MATNFPPTVVRPPSEADAFPIHTTLFLHDANQATPQFRGPARPQEIEGSGVTSFSVERPSATLRDPVPSPVEGPGLEQFGDQAFLSASAYAPAEHIEPRRARKSREKVVEDVLFGWKKNADSEYENKSNLSRIRSIRIHSLLPGRAKR